MSIDSTIQKMALAAKKASMQIAKCPSSQKNEALLTIATQIQEKAAYIKTENNKDLMRAQKMEISAAMIDRLTIRDATIQAMIKGLKEVAELEDPVGSLSRTWLRPNGLQVSRMRIPLGVIGITNLD